MELPFIPLNTKENRLLLSRDYVKYKLLLTCVENTAWPMEGAEIHQVNKFIVNIRAD